MTSLVQLNGMVRILEIKAAFLQIYFILKVNRPTESSRVTPIPTGKILFVLVMRLLVLECFPGILKQRCL